MNGAGTAPSPRFVSRAPFCGDEPSPPLHAHLFERTHCLWVATGSWFGSGPQATRDHQIFLRLWLRQFFPPRSLRL